MELLLEWLRRRYIRCDSYPKCRELPEKTPPSDEKGDFVDGEHGLSLATEKTEDVLLTRQGIPTETEMMVGTDAIATNNAVKYLGVRFDCKPTFWEQIREACGKTGTLVHRLLVNANSQHLSPIP